MGPSVQGVDKVGRALGRLTARGPTGTTFPLTFPFDTGIPAAPGHYNYATIFGIAAPPGIHFNIQVNQLKR